MSHGVVTEESVVECLILISIAIPLKNGIIPESIPIPES